MSDIRSRMEPLSPPGDLGTYTASADAALTSIAMSLKRIADRLDDIASGAAALNCDVRQA